MPRLLFERARRRLRLGRGLSRGAPGPDPRAARPSAVARPMPDVAPLIRIVAPLAAPAIGYASASFSLSPPDRVVSRCGRWRALGVRSPLRGGRRRLSAGEGRVGRAHLPRRGIQETGRNDSCARGGCTMAVPGPEGLTLTSCGHCAGHRPSSGGGGNRADGHRVRQGRRGRQDGGRFSAREARAVPDGESSSSARVSRIHREGRVHDASTSTPAGSCTSERHLRSHLADAQKESRVGLVAAVAGCYEQGGGRSGAASGVRYRRGLIGSARADSLRGLRAAVRLHADSYFPSGSGNRPL